MLKYKDININFLLKYKDINVSFLIKHKDLRILCSSFPKYKQLISSSLVARLCLIVCAR